MAGDKKPAMTAKEQRAKRAQARAKENQILRAQREALAMEKWALIRAKGMMRYVVRHGLLMWTLMTTGIYILLLGVTLKFKFTSEVILQIGFAVAFFAIGGILFGLATWYLSESRFKHHQAQRLKQKEAKKSKK